MASKIKVDQIEGSTASTVSLPSGQTLDLSSGSITLPDSAVDLSTAKVTGTLGSGNLPTIPVSKGGTGITSLGSAGEALKVNSGGTALEFGSVAGGKILQVQHGNHTSQATTTSSGYVDVSTNTNVAITPSATSSKILILAHFNELYHSGSNNTTSHYIAIDRDSTRLQECHTMYTSSLSGEEMWNQDLIYVDSPNSTSSHTYKLKFRSANGNQVRVNQNSMVGGTTITLLEIGA